MRTDRQTDMRTNGRLWQTNKRFPQQCELALKKGPTSAAPYGVRHFSTRLDAVRCDHVYFVRACVCVCLIAIPNYHVKTEAPTWGFILNSISHGQKATWKIHVFSYDVACSPIFTDVSKALRSLKAWVTIYQLTWRTGPWRLESQKHQWQNFKSRKVRLVFFHPDNYHNIANSFLRFIFVINLAVLKRLMSDVLTNDSPSGSNSSIWIHVTSVRLTHTLNCSVLV
jgi:hypothetical protein